MKKVLLLLILTIKTVVYSQSQFQNIATSNGSSERVAVFGVNDAPTSILEITNSTVATNQFIPTIWAHQQADNRFVLRNFASTNSANDNGIIPIMIFRAELRNQINLTGPSEVPYPWGGSAANVVNRPLFAWENGNTQLMRIAANGNITIGTALTPSTFKLAVGGKIIAEELKVQLQAQWPDYVFAKDYKMQTLPELEKQIQEKGHLPNMPSSKEVKENGIELGEMAKMQQEKIEELTLYLIQQNKEIVELKELVNKLINK